MASAERNDSISARLRSSFKLDHVFQIAVLDDEIRFTGLGALGKPANRSLGKYFFNWFS